MDAEIDRRIGAGEVPERRAERAGQHRAGQADVDDAGGARADGTGPFHRFAGPLQNGERLDVEIVAGPGQRHPPRGPLEEGSADLILQVANLLAEGWLRTPRLSAAAVKLRYLATATK